MNSGAYTSDFATFNSSASRSYNLGLGTLSAPLTLGAGGFLSSLIANVNGQFTVDSGGFTPNTPEPASIVLSALGALVFSALAISKRKRNGATGRRKLDVDYRQLRDSRFVYCRLMRWIANIGAPLPEAGGVNVPWAVTNCPASKPLSCAGSGRTTVPPYSSIGPSGGR